MSLLRAQTVRRVAILLRRARAVAPRNTRQHCDSTIAPDAKYVPCRVVAAQTALSCRGTDHIAPCRSVTLTFVDAKKHATAVTGKEGQNLVDLAHKNDIELEGACECSLACSTCHVILDESVFDELEPAEETEEDLLDLAFGLTPT